MASDIDLDNEISVTPEQIIWMLSSCDKDFIIDIPTILINNADRIDFNELINIAFEAGSGYSLLALIDVANKLEHNDAFFKVLSRQYPSNIEGNVIEDNIFPVHKFRQLIKRSFLERIEERWNVRIAFTFDDFYKIYRDYHLLPVHGEGLRKYFGDIIEI
ncbi:MAG: hypothetical protein HF976_08905 [ANME-2 cluster archaeon]|nr:hypothetical protein [ANME-2 cluster archaeon]MBC2701515.1 hypothetical protein [ANME-2 cluster archaeon]MBC2706840.1 hypothetical protein [ANME-2 cluster archaeon]MBC2746129.1 hypothetical protein [ANME-2 cluster archaeon]MBC2762185.1 hypothetical protein [ANME-2 cluster archaeon]